MKNTSSDPLAYIDGAPPAPRPRYKPETRDVYRVWLIDAEFAVKQAWIRRAMEVK